jgi:hypothetical protein
MQPKHLMYARKRHIDKRSIHAKAGVIDQQINMVPVLSAENIQLMSGVRLGQVEHGSFNVNAIGVLKGCGESL